MKSIELPSTENIDIHGINASDHQQNDVSAIETGTEKEKEANGNTLLYRVDDVPPWHACIAFGIQQLLLAVGGFLTFPLIMMGVLCADNSDALAVNRALVIGTQMFVAGVATFIQTTFGIRIPVLQGLAAAYFVPALAIMGSDQWKCPAPINLNMSQTMAANLTVYHGENSTLTLEDSLNNISIIVDSSSNYYRDNDGIVRSSNELWTIRMREIQGAIIVAGTVQIVIGLTGIMGFFLRFIGPLTIAPILVLISYALAETSVRLAGTQWGVAILMIATFFITSFCMDRVKVPLPKFNCRPLKCTTTKQPIFSMFPILIATLLGWLVCFIVTTAGGFPDDPAEPAYKARTDITSGALERSPWFSFPYPFQWGIPTFTVSSIFGMMAAVLPGILESIGDYNAGAVMCQEPAPPKHAINRGVVMEGFGILTAGLLGTGNATTSYSGNVVVIGITRVASRRVFQCAGIILVILGMFTKFSSLFVTLPGVVLGGVMCCTCGMILAVGVSTLKYVDMRISRNLFIFGFSVFFGIVVPMYASKNSDRIDVGVIEINNIFLVLLRTPMFVGGICGFVLDNIAPGTYDSRGLKAFVNVSTPGDPHKSLSTYDLPFKNDFAWTRWIPVCPSFGSPKRKSSTAA